MRSLANELASYRNQEELGRESALFRHGRSTSIACFHPFSILDVGVAHHALGEEPGELHYHNQCY